MPEVVSPNLRMLLLPGLNGDERVYAPQREAFPQASVVHWIPPEPSEGIASFARRLAQTLDPAEPCLVVGVSFGGLVALEFCQHVNAKACVIIASAQNTQGLPRAIRLMRPVASITPTALLDRATRIGWCTATALSPALSGLPTEQQAFRQWALRAMMQWKPPRAVCPVVQIHGDSDAQFPHGAKHADEVIGNAGHLLTVTHGVEINARLNKILTRYRL